MQSEKNTLIQLECSIDEQIAEELSTFLEDDSLSMSWYEKTPEEWILQVVGPSGQEPYVRNKIISFFKEKDMVAPHVTSSPLPQKDWVAAVYRDSPPLTIGRFYIYGSHIQSEPPAELLSLRIDAATAFGSGQHESTEGCLKALTRLAEQQSFQHALDMGCGSGILALAMASLWHISVLACDNDPESVRVTLENAQLNHLKDLIDAEVSEGFTTLKEKTFDIITANILAGPLCHMAGDVSKALRPEGHIILAGLLNRQAQDVIDAYRSVGIKLVDQLFIGDWSTLIMRK